MTDFQHEFKDLVHSTRIYDVRSDLDSLGFSELQICKMLDFPCTKSIAYTFVAIINDRIIRIRNMNFWYEHPSIPKMHIHVQIPSPQEQVIDAVVVISAQYNADGTVTYRIPANCSYCLAKLYFDQFPIDTDTIDWMMGYQMNDTGLDSVATVANRENQECGPQMNVYINRNDDYNKITFSLMNDQADSDPE